MLQESVQNMAAHVNMVFARASERVAKEVVQRYGVARARDLFTIEERSHPMEFGDKMILQTIRYRRADGVYYPKEVALVLESSGHCSVEIRPLDLDASELTGDVMEVENAAAG